jgi:hypothetical protein
MADQQRVRTGLAAGGGEEPELSVPSLESVDARGTKQETEMEWPRAPTAVVSQ